MHVKRALTDVHEALKNEGQKKREAVIDQLKSHAAVVMKKLEAKQGNRKHCE